jgi:spore coat polysaccharide biosynthesis protein SpsF
VKLVTIIQARTGSTRLPGKVLAEVGGSSVLSWVVHRVRRSEHHGTIVVATSKLDRDDAVAVECARVGVPCFRGSEGDVLDRYYRAMKAFEAEIVVRVTADCPLLDAALFDLTVDSHVRGAADYVTVEGVPEGLPAETISHAALRRAWREATAAYDREHVTPYVFTRPDEFDVVMLQPPPALARSDWRLTLDDEHDLALLRALHDATGGTAIELGADELVEIVAADPHLLELATRRP